MVAKVLETWGPCGVLASLSQMELFLSHDFSRGDKQQLSLGCSPSHCLFICCEGPWCWCSAIFLGKGSRGGSSRAWGPGILNLRTEALVCFGHVSKTIFNV